MLMDMLAGVVCGLVMGTVFLGAGIFVLATKPDTYDRLSKSLPQGLSPTLVMLFLVIAVPPLWALFGAIGGLLYRLADDSFPNAGLGSANLAFTLAIVSLAALVSLILLVAGIARKRAVWPGLVMDIAFAGVFGWILPLLASWR